MLPNPRKITFKFKRPLEKNGFPDSSTAKLDEFLDISSSSSSSTGADKSHDSDDENGSQSKQIVLYNPEANNNDNDLGRSSSIMAVPEDHQRPKGFPFIPSGPLPSVGAFTVQCAGCFKWRLIPTKEKYEEIREHILEKPFYCKTALEWRPEITCDDPPDISQDGSRLWAIDKPNIAQPPLGWQRLLRIRGKGSTKFADVYYVAPSGKRLRSLVEIEKYISDHPELQTEGLSMSQFSFRTPKPLQDNYVRKRPRPIAPCDGTRHLMPDLVRPLAWAGPNESTDLQLGMPQIQLPLFSEPVDRDRPLKKLAIKTPSKSEFRSSDPRFDTESSSGLDQS